MFPLINSILLQALHSAVVIVLILMMEGPGFKSRSEKKETLIHQQLKLI